MGTRHLLKSTYKALNNIACHFYPAVPFDAAYRPEDAGTMKSYNRNRPYGPSPVLCYAPFRSLFFNTEGHALSCCKNTKVVLGTYPQQSIREMWEGQNIHKLREHILHNDLSFGCYKCREALQAGNYAAMTSCGFDFLRAHKKSNYPQLMEFELSNQCNLECVMCSGRVSSGISSKSHNPQSRKTPYDLAFADQLEPFIPALKQARFYGGEPFLIDLYYEIWERMLRHNPAINLYVLTNGTILNEKVKALLKRGRFTIHVSVDSFNPELYEKIRVNARFSQTMNNLQYFIQYMKTHGQRLCIYVTPTRMNWQEIPEMVRQCDSMGTDIYFSTAWYPAHLSLWNLPLEELEAIERTYNNAPLSRTSNGKAFKMMRSEITRWVLMQKQDPEYRAHFLQYAVRQEEKPEDALTEIIESDADLYKTRLAENLLQACQNEDRVSELITKIDQLIVAGDLNALVVYYYLKGLSPGHIIERLLSEPMEKNLGFLQSKQEEILSTIQIKPGSDEG